MHSPPAGSIRNALLWVAVLALVILLVLWLMTGPPPTDRRGAVSLAVLPFSDAGSDRGQSHLTAGLSVDLLDRLKLIEGLQCVAREEILAHRPPSTAPRQLAQSLGAEILVTASLIERSGKISVTVEIHDARQGRRPVSHQLEGSRDQLLELQNRLADLVVSSLDLRLTADEVVALHRNSTRSLKAWDAFSQGVRSLEDLINPRSPAFAAEFLERAVQLDPSFSQARAYLSLALWQQSMNQRGSPSHEAAVAQAAQALRQSPDMDAAAVAFALTSPQQPRSENSLVSLISQASRLPKLDQAARALAANWLRVGELGLAEAAWLAAIEVSPDYWLNAYGYGQFLLRGGRHGEAEQVFLRAAQISPADNTWPGESILTLRLALGDLAGAIEEFETLDAWQPEVEMARQMAAVYSILSRLEPAEQLYRRALDLDSSNPRIRQELGDILTRSGRLDEAAIEYALALEGLEAESQDGVADPENRRHFALLAAKAGRCSEALPLAVTLLRHQPDSAAASHDLARVFATCRDAPLTLEALNAAIRQGLSPELIRSQSEFDWLAGDEEFIAILGDAEALPPSP